MLSEAGLSVSRKRGRQRWHYLNTVPLQKLHRRWAEPAAAGFASALLRLHNTVEAEGRHMAQIQPIIDIALDIEIAGRQGGSVLPRLLEAAQPVRCAGSDGRPALRA